jgi:hypothetical protein
MRNEGGKVPRSRNLMVLQELQKIPSNRQLIPIPNLSMCDCDVVLQAQWQTRGQ